MKDLKQQNATDSNKGNFSSKITQKVMEIAEDMPDDYGISISFDNFEKGILFKCGNQSYYILTDKGGFNRNIEERTKITKDHYKSGNFNVYLSELDGNESTFLERYRNKCREEEKLKKPSLTKGGLLKYFEHFDIEYKLSLKHILQIPHSQSTNIQKGDIETFESKVVSLGDFIEKTGEIINKIKIQKKSKIDITFNYAESPTGLEVTMEKNLPYIKLEHDNYTKIIAPTYNFNYDYVKDLLHKKYVKCELCISDRDYECKGDDERINFYYYKFGADSLSEYRLVHQYILGNTPLHSDNTGRYKGNRKEVLKYFYNSTQQFCQKVKNESITKKSNNNYTIAALSTVIPAVVIPSVSQLISNSQNSTCTDLAPVLRQRALRQHIINHDDTISETIGAYLVILMFAAVVVIGLFVFACNKIRSRRRSLNNRRELEALERDGVQSQPEEIACLPIQNGSEQQSDSDNEASEIQNDINDQQLVLNEASDHSSFVIDDEETPQISSRSNTPSRTGSSSSPRSGAVSQAGSSVSIEEDGRSGASSEESGSDNSQRSSSPANAPQKPPRTLVQNVGGGSRSPQSKNVVNQVVGCLRNSC